MLPVLLSVVVISLSGVMMPGLMFGVTLAKSLKSPWAGAQMALGHAVIEVPLILLIYYGIARFSQSAVLEVTLSIIGGGMIIWLGIGMFRARIQLVQEGKDIPYNAFVAGIFTSIINPFFLLWWATVGTMLVAKFYAFGTTGLAAFTVVHWLCDLAWLSFVSVLIYKTQSLWGRQFQQGLFIACSLALAGFGAWYLFSGVKLLF